MKKSAVFFFILFLLIPIVSFFPSYATTNQVPEWLKNNAKWWSEGKITEDEYLTGLQFLADEGFLQISSQKEIPLMDTKSTPLDNIRAKYYLVRFSGGEFESPLEISTFSNFIPGDRPHYLQSFYDQGFETFFTLESNPSKDKLEFYNLVAAFYNVGKKPELFDVDIEILSEKNSPIITAQYAKCKITEYVPYLQGSIIFYPFSDSKGAEVRDRSVFYCSGVKITGNNSELKEPEFLKPTKNDRITSYVVHFMGPDFDGLYSVGTFSKFAPSKNQIETPYDIITFPSNPVNSKPQFFLESLPSRDKKQLYELFSDYVNQGPQPHKFDVSVDLILGDGSVFQRWNYHECDLTDYAMQLEDSTLRFPFSNDRKSEILDRSDFLCNGLKLDVGLDLPNTPIIDPRTIQGEFVKPKIPVISDTAESFIFSVFGGEFSDAIIGKSVYKFETIRRDRGPLTPLHHSKQYDFGFIVESLPTHEKKTWYNFLSRYVNPGKAPEPFDVTLDTKLGNNSILHRIHYTNCEAVDFSWYLQDAKWLYQFSNKQEEEIRERFVLYCEGLRVEFP